MTLLEHVLLICYFKFCHISSLMNIWAQLLSRTLLYLFILRFKLLPKCILMQIHSANLLMHWLTEMLDKLFYVVNHLKNAVKSLGLTDINTISCQDVICNVNFYERASNIALSLSFLVTNMFSLLLSVTRKIFNSIFKLLLMVIFAIILPLYLLTSGWISKVRYLTLTLYVRILQ
jgi:hypothetical protein